LTFVSHTDRNIEILSLECQHIFFFLLRTDPILWGLGGRVEKVKERKTVLAMKHSRVQVI
jgi:hypothetical protein